MRSSKGDIIPWQHVHQRSPEGINLLVCLKSLRVSSVFRTYRTNGRNFKHRFSAILANRSTNLFQKQRRPLTLLYRSEGPIDRLCIYVTKAWCTDAAHIPQMLMLAMKILHTALNKQQTPNPKVGTFNHSNIIDCAPQIQQTCLLSH